MVDKGANMGGDFGRVGKWQLGPEMYVCILIDCKINLTKSYLDMVGLC